MSHDRESIFEQKIALFEREKRCWDTLHAKLEGVLEAKSAKPGERGWQDYRYAETSTIEGALGSWTVSISDLSDMKTVAYNRWGHELSQPIEITLYIGDNGQPFDRSIADDPKLAITCSPHGVIDSATGEHLDVEAVEALLSDPHLFEG